VDLPWSICAMMQKLRMKSGSIVYWVFLRGVAARREEEAHARKHLSVP
jgi:hypothetical protein